MCVDTVKKQIRDLFGLYSSARLLFACSSLMLAGDPPQRLCVRVWRADTKKAGMPKPVLRDVGEFVEDELQVLCDYKDLVKDLLFDIGFCKQFRNLMGLKFNVRIIPPGGLYGQLGSLQYGGEPLVAVKPYLEFYDDRYRHGPLGQNICHYYLEDILKRKPSGLDLMVHVESWKIDQETMDEILEWCEERKKVLDESFSDNQAGQPTNS